MATDVDRVRLLIGDTDVDNYQLTDEEIEEFISYRKVENEDEEWVTNLPAAGADCADAIAAQYARDFNFGEDSQTFQVAMRHSQYLALAETLRRRAGAVSA